MRCRCGSSKTEADTASGTIVCVGCGEVLEENTIVSEITFQETGGKTTLSGSFAGSSGNISGGGPFGRGRGREGQEQAMDNGRHKIARLAYALHLPERYRESAQRYYNLAVVNRFTRGRKSEHVAAVCLYIVCRTEKSSQMLIDFSDLLQANVFVLGSTFLKLVRTLNLKLPLIDPSIYISRFAAALDFGEYTQRVAHDAVRLVQRMDRDWIRTGRRPAGICGACLLMAARMNGFRRTTKEMIYIVKVAEITIHSRLKEFKHTESASLTVRDFRNIWLETEADPPAFSNARKDAEKTKKRVRKGLGDEEEEEAEEEEEEEEEFDELDSDIDSVLSRRPAVVAASPAAMSVLSHDGMSLASTPAATAHSPEDTQSTLVGGKDDTQSTLVNPQLEKEAEKLGEEMNEWMKTDRFMKESVAYEKESAEKTAAEEAAKQTQTNDANLSEVDDDEIEAMILSPIEVRLKTTIWYNANKDYLEEMKAKMLKIEMDKRNGIFVKKGKGAKRRKFTQAATPAEAAKQLLTSKKFSKKINQAVFDGMFESPENIEKMKEIDKFKELMREANLNENTGDYAGYEVVEESGDLQSKKKAEAAGGKELTANEGEGAVATAAGEAEEEEDDDDEDIDLDDMADDERMMLEGRRRMGWTEMEADDDYYDFDDD